MRAKTYVLGLLVAGALLALAACNGDGNGNGDGENGDGSAASPTSEATPTVEASPPPEVCPKVDDEVVQSMVALLELDKSSYEQGEPVELTLRLVNCSRRPITRTFPDAQRYDFAAKPENGDEVWRWSSGMAFAEDMGEETYEPSEQLTFTETWDQLDNDGRPVEPGQYEISAESTGCDDPLQNCGPLAARFIEITAP